MVVVFFVGVLSAGVLSVVVGMVVRELCFGMGAVLNVGVVSASIGVVVGMLSFGTVVVFTPTSSDIVDLLGVDGSLALSVRSAWLPRSAGAAWSVWLSLAR